MCQADNKGCCRPVAILASKSEASQRANTVSRYKFNWEIDKLAKSSTDTDPVSPALGGGGFISVIFTGSPIFENKFHGYDLVGRKPWNSGFRNGYFDSCFSG